MIIYDGNTRGVSFAEDTPLTAEEIAELEALAAEQPTPEPTPEERIAAAEAQIQAAMADIEKAKNDLSDVQIIKNILGLEGNG